MIPGYNFDVLAKRLVAFSGGGGKSASHLMNATSNSMELLLFRVLCTSTCLMVERSGHGTDYRRPDPDL